MSIEINQVDRPILYVIFEGDAWEKVVVERTPRDRGRREGGWVKRREKCRLYRVGRER
jgi:hypothetical protein